MNNTQTYDRLHLTFSSSVKGGSIPHSVAETMVRGLARIHAAQAYVVSREILDNPAAASVLGMKADASLRRPLTQVEFARGCDMVRESISYLKGGKLADEHDFGDVSVKVAAKGNTLKAHVVFTPVNA